MVNAAFKREVKASEVVIHEGDMFQSEFFIVESGSFQFSVSQRYGGEHDKIDQYLIFLNLKMIGQNYDDLTDKEEFREILKFLKIIFSDSASCPTLGLVHRLVNLLFCTTPHAPLPSSQSLTVHYG